MPGCCSADNCVGPEDFPFMYGAVQEAIQTNNPNCNNPYLKLPLPCMSAASLELPTDDELRRAGLRPPPSDWEGYNRGVFRRLDTRQGIKNVRRTEGAGVRGEQ
jgi:hypothetical protein